MGQCWCGCEFGADFPPPPHVQGSLRMNCIQHGGLAHGMRKAILNVFHFLYVLDLMRL